MLECQLFHRPEDRFEKLCHPCCPVSLAQLEEALTLLIATVQEDQLVFEQQVCDWLSAQPKKCEQLPLLTFSTPEFFSIEQACASMRSEASGDEIALLNSYNLIPNTDVGDEIVTVTTMTATALGRRP